MQSVDSDLMARSCEVCTDLSAQLSKAKSVIARQRAQIIQLSDHLQEERQKTAKLENMMLKMEADLEERYDFVNAVPKEELSTDDVNTATMEESLALMAVNKAGAAASAAGRGRRGGNRAGNLRGRGRRSTAAGSVAIDAPKGTDVNISIRY